MRKNTDNISREDALEAFKPRGISQDAWEESTVYKTIKALPTIENWIPTEKDNPKTDGRYIVTARVFGACDPDHKGPYTDEVGESVFRKGKWPMTFNYLPCKIIAWQPLPERYKAESEDNQMVEVGKRYKVYTPMKRRLLDEVEVTEVAGNAFYCHSIAFGYDTAYDLSDGIVVEEL